MFITLSQSLKQHLQNVFYCPTNSSITQDSKWQRKAAVNMLKLTAASILAFSHLVKTNRVLSKAGQDKLIDIFHLNG